MLLGPSARECVSVISRKGSRLDRGGKSYALADMESDNEMPGAKLELDSL